ncbi:MAG TPA: hypothetical protein VHA06_05710, partial [Candidatus Angelobacter sp.]|nr:hypothetical protein [Candidatus Angelobacter sp.]
QLLAAVVVLELAAGAGLVAAQVVFHYLCLNRWRGYMAQCTHTTVVTLADGSKAEHIAEALGYRMLADGVVSILAACCGQVGGALCGECNGVGCKDCGHVGVHAIKGAEDTRSWHSFYDIGMPTSDGNGGLLPPIDPASEVAAHVKRVAEGHAARHKARVSGLDGLMRPKATAERQTLGE